MVRRGRKLGAPVRPEEMCIRDRESYVNKGKEKILDYLNNGTEVPGFRRVSRKGTDTVAPEDVAKYATINLPVCGHLSLSDIQDSILSKYGTHLHWDMLLSLIHIYSESPDYIKIHL